MIKCGVTQTLKFKGGVEVDIRGLSVVEVLRMRAAIADVGEFTTIVLSGVVAFRGLADAQGKPLSPADGETPADIFTRLAPSDIGEEVATKILKLSGVNAVQKKK